MFRRAVFLALTAVALAGCGSSSSLKQNFREGIAQVRGTQDYEVRRDRIARTLKKLRSDRPGSERRAKALALKGFTWTLRGTESQIDFHENDRGEIVAARRDARRANDFLTRGAKQLRAAGRLLGVRVGTLNGY